MGGGCSSVQHEQCIHGPSYFDTTLSAVMREMNINDPRTSLSMYVKSAKREQRMRSET
jgi:hypothetical protein